MRWKWRRLSYRLSGRANIMVGRVTCREPEGCLLTTKLKLECWRAMQSHHCNTCSELWLLNVRERRKAGVFDNKFLRKAVRLTI